MSSKYAIRSAFQSPRSPFFTVSVWRIETTFLQSSKVVLQRVRSFLYDVCSFLYDVDLKLISPLTTTKHSSATCVKQRQTFALQNTSSSSTQIQFLSSYFYLTALRVKRRVMYWTCQFHPWLTDCSTPNFSSTPSGKESLSNISFLRTKCWANSVGSVTGT